MQHLWSNSQTQLPRNTKTGGTRDNGGAELTSVLGENDHLTPCQEIRLEAVGAVVARLSPHLAQHLAAKKLLQEKRAQQNVQFAQNVL